MEETDNFYKILNVPDTATIDEIKRSYRKLSMMYHPDRNKTAEAITKIQKINEAYEVLGDAQKRKEYDMMNNNPFFKMMNNPMNAHSSGSVSVDDIFANIFGFGGGFPMNMGPMNMGPMNVGGINISSMINEMGGGNTFPPNTFPPNTFPPNIRIFRNGQQVNVLQKPTPIIKSIDVPIDKILTGTTIPLVIERWLIENGNKLFEEETIYVDIPKGIDDGEMIIMRDRGNVLNDECKGDIKIAVKIENNTELKRSGLDLVYNKTITVKEALCGFSFELKYITGKIYTITNTSGNIIYNGYCKTIPNMGFTRERDSSAHIGNLLINFTIKFPEKISQEVMETLMKLDF